MIVCTSERERMDRMFQRPQQSVLSCRLARWRSAEAHIAPGLMALVLWAALLGYVVFQSENYKEVIYLGSRTDPP